MAADNTTVEHITLEVPPKTAEFGRTVSFVMETAQDVFDWYERLCDDGAAPILYESPNEGDQAEFVVCRYEVDEGVVVRVIGEIKR